MKNSFYFLIKYFSRSLNYDGLFFVHRNDKAASRHLFFMSICNLYTVYEEIPLEFSKDCSLYAMQYSLGSWFFVCYICKGVVDWYEKGYVSAS